MQFSDSYFCSVKPGVAKTCFAGVDGVLILIIEVASTLFTHGPLGGFLSPTVLASSNSNYLLEENMAYWKNARLWAEISWSDNTSRDLQFARVPFTALLYATFFQQILALHHDLFKTLLYWLTNGAEGLTLLTFRSWTSSIEDIPSPWRSHYVIGYS